MAKKNPFKNWWNNATAKSQTYKMSDGSKYYFGSSYGIKKPGMRPSVFREAKVAVPGRTYWYPGKGASDTAIYGDGNAFDKAWNKKHKKATTTARSVYPNYPAGNTIYSGSTASSSNPFSEWDYLKYLSDQNTAINIAMNRENNAFSAEQAKLQRNWETEMSNTAHQREVKDLQAAGLNPVLSANAGAAVPVGASAGASNFSGADSSAVNALAGVLEATLSANATMSAASMSAAASMFGANRSAEAAEYSARKSYAASRYATDTQSVYGLIGDIIHGASMIATGGAGAYGAVKAAGKTKRSESFVHSNSFNTNHNYSHRR